MVDGKKSCDVAIKMKMKRKVGEHKPKMKEKSMQTIKTIVPTTRDRGVQTLKNLVAS